MARNTTLTLPAATWTQLTNGDVTNISFENQSDDYLFVAFTAGESAPSSTDGAIRYRPNYGADNMTLANTFSGVTGGTRVYGYIENGGRVWVSHA